MSNRAWKATLQNGFKVEIDYTENVDQLEVSVGNEDIGWQHIQEVEDRTPAGDENRIWVATLVNDSQILVNYWASENLATIAYRTDRWMSWWAPVNCQEILVTAGDQS